MAKPPTWLGEPRHGDLLSGLPEGARRDPEGASIVQLDEFGDVLAINDGRYYIAGKL